MMIVLPDWYIEAKEKLTEVIRDIAIKNNINFAFVEDSLTIQNGRDAILSSLVTIGEMCKTPYSVVKEEKPRQRKKYTKYTPEMDEFIRSNAPKTKRAELCSLIKDRFGIDVTVHALNNYVSKRKIRSRK